MEAVKTTTRTAKAKSVEKRNAMTVMADTKTTFAQKRSFGDASARDERQGAAGAATDASPWRWARRGSERWAAGGPGGGRRTEVAPDHVARVGRGLDGDLHARREEVALRGGGHG